MCGKKSELQEPEEEPEHGSEQAILFIVNFEPDNGKYGREWSKVLVRDMSDGWLIC